jgi:hypothetical protein
MMRPKYEDVDVRARSHDERHVVLDQQDSQAAAGELEQQVPRAFQVSSLSSPDDGFVEQEHAAARAGAERARHALRARAVPVGASRPCGRRPRADSDPFEQLVGECGSVVTLGCPAPPHLERHEDVLARGEAAERLEPWEGAGNARAARACGAWRA